MATLGGIIITLGLSQINFGTSIPIQMLDPTNNTSQSLIDFKNNVIKSGWDVFWSGVVITTVGPFVFILIILSEKVRVKKNIFKAGLSSILFDEMYDGKEIELKNHGYDAYSVKNLRLDGEPLQYDYSVLKYVEKNKMILITEDSENYGGCIENGLPCIKLGQNPSIDEILKELEILKNNDSSRS